MLSSPVNAQPISEHKHAENQQAQVKPAALTTDQHAAHHVDKSAGAATTGDPYPLKVCPVSGMELGKMGAAVVKVYNGREVRFCCAECPKKFEADQATYFKKIDAMIVKDQLAYYPLDTCVVSGESLAENGEDISINMIYKNRLLRLCCKECVAKVKADPDTYLKKLDAAVIAAQRASYPLKTCVVSGEKIEGMGEPVEVVVANRLVRLCCKSCKKDLLNNPASYLQKLDGAWSKSPGGTPSADGMPKRMGMMNEHKGMGMPESGDKGEHKHVQNGVEEGEYEGHV